MAKPKKAAIIGATGFRGQNFIKALMGHPWIQIVSLHGASSIGKTFKESRKGFSSAILSEEILNMKIKSNKDIDLNNIDLIFSAVPSSVASKIEPELAIMKPVISSAAAFRYEPDIPIYLPIINSDHYKMFEKQKENRGWNGFIIPLPNRATIGLAISLTPILRNFGIKNVHITSLHSISGSGYPGVAAHDIDSNILPQIPLEEERIIKEIKKIMGHWNGEEIVSSEFLIDAKCYRVPVLHGYTSSVFIETVKETNPKDIINCWKEFKCDTCESSMELPSRLEKPIIYFDDPYRPQPRVDINNDPLSTLIGGLERTEFPNGFKFTVVINDVELGRGSGGILAAEYLIAKGII